MSLQQSSFPAQGRVINRANRFLKRLYRSTGLTLNNEGICSGLSTLYVTHKCKGEGAIFFNNLKKINTLTTESYKQNSSQVAQFVQRAQFSFLPYLYNKNIEQGEIDKIYQSRDDAFVKTNNFGIAVDCTNLGSLLNECMNDGEGVHLSANQHAIALYKNAGRYYIYDPNFNDDDKADPHMTPDGDKEYLSVEEFSKEIQKCLLVRNDERMIAINYKSFIHVPDIKLINTIKTQPMSQDLLKKYISKQDTDANRTLFISVLANDTKMVESVLSSTQCDPTAVDPRYKTSAFSAACNTNDPKVIKLMLNQRSIPVDLFMEGLKAAASGGYPKTTESLLSYLTTRYQYKVSSDDILDLFTSACQGSNPAILATIMNFASQKFTELKSPFLEESKKLTCEAFMDAAIKGNNSRTVKFLLKEFGRNIDITTNLAKATEQGQLNCLRELLSHQKSPDAKHLLYIAVLHEQKQIAQYLINEYKIKPTFDVIQLAVKNQDIDTLYLLLNQYKYQTATNDNSNDLAQIDLLKDALAGDVSALKSILKFNVQENTIKEPKFAQHLLLTALYSKNKTLVENLLKLNVSIDEQSKKFAFEKLILACEEKDAMLASLLVKAGINPFQMISKGDFRGLAPITINPNDSDFNFQLIQACKNIPEDDAIQLLCSYAVEGTSDDLKNTTALLLAGNPNLIEALNSQTFFLNSLFDQAKFDTINLLLSRGLTLPYDNLLEKFSYAYGIKYDAKNPQLLKDLLEIATNKQHFAIVKTLEKTKGAEVNHLQSNHENPNKATSTYGFVHSSLNHTENNNNNIHQRSNSTDQIVLAACASGNLAVIKNIYQEEKPPLSLNGKDLLETAIGNKAIIAYFLEKMSPREIKAKLLDALTKKQTMLIATILEALPPKGVLTEADLRIFDALKTEIYENYSKKYLTTDHRQDDRLKDIIHNKNALAIFLNMPAQTTETVHNKVGAFRKK